MTNTARSSDAAALRLLLQRIVSTVDDELDYDAAESLMARYVDDRIAGRDTSESGARLHAHLKQCPESADVLAVLEDLAALDAVGDMPEVDDLWADVRSACKPQSTAQRATAQTPATTVARDRATQGVLGGVRGWFDSLSPRPLVAVPAMLLALLVVTSVGWWRADGRADQNGLLVQTVAGATSMQFNEMGDGAWARVAYDPDDRHALVWAGGLPGTTDGEHYECWFTGRNGDRILARAIERFQGDPAWYHLETDRLVNVYDLFVMTREPQGDVVIEVALHDPTR